MKPHDSWQKLASAARQAPTDERDTAAPLGFATRVAAQAFSERRRPAPVFAQFFLRSSLRALCAAGALAAIAAVMSYPAAIKLFSPREAAAAPSLAAAPVVAPAVPKSVTAASAPVSDATAASSSSSDDPVTDLVDLAS